MLFHNKKPIAAKQLLRLCPEELRACEPAGEDVTPLAESIRRNGIISPLVVRYAAGGYEVVCGKRRLAAAKKAGLRTLPCLLIAADDGRAALLSIADNLHHNEMSLHDLALAVNDTMRNYRLAARETAGILGMSQAELNELLSLLHTPPEEPTPVEPVPTPREPVPAPPSADPDPSTAPDPKPTEPGHKMAVGDAQLFLNSINRIVSAMRISGFLVASTTEETENGIDIVIHTSRVPVGYPTRQFPLAK